MGAFALTDSGNLYGAVDFFKAFRAVGVKPIIGCTLFLAPTSRFEKKRLPNLPASFPIVLLATNKEGYQNLCKLSSAGFLDGFYYTPRIDKELLREHSKGLICLSSGYSGELGSALIHNQEDLAEKTILFYQELFGEDYYFELQRYAMQEERVINDQMTQESWLYQSYLDLIKNQEKVNRNLVDLGKKHSVRSVATHEVLYLEREDWKAHEILINISSGEPCEIWEKDSFGNPKLRINNPKRRVQYTHELYFKSQKEMELLFSDLPESLESTLEIAEKCHLELDFKTRYYPVFIPPALEGKSFSSDERIASVEQFLCDLCKEGVSKRYDAEKLAKVSEKYPGKNPLDVVQNRLSLELEIITSKGMVDYLLIVYDFIAWAKKEGIPMGPGRGSGAGSIILYLIGITDIEPLRFNLFFERFINPERLSYPDIDVDICMERRQEVIDYTVRKYGKEKVAQIITFGTMKAKMAIKDVGRCLSVPLAKVNLIAKLVPEELNITLEKALEVDPELLGLYQTDEEVMRLLDIAKKLEGSIRNTGIHAAGLIISGDPITDHIPVCLAKDSGLVATQYSMKPVEAVGMLKIDFLGLKTLTSIDKAVRALKAYRGIEIDWVNLPLEDSLTFALLTQGKTNGMFQLESSGMQELAKQLHIDKFEEIIAVGALYRPGPMEMIPSFIARKHGREKIEIDHPLMHEVLAETYGIMVYQEQVMQIASLLAHYSLGEGDVLRRAMGKKDHNEMARQREKFREGALKNGIEAELSMAIFDKIEKFASYGFNKSHAAAYGYLTYVTAYLKAHYPSEWMAALMTSDRDDLSRVAKLIQEAKLMSIALLPPDVNESEKEFTATNSGIRFALAGIKGIGEGVVEAILEERSRNGLFKSLYDFFKRIDTRRVGKKAVENLIEAGCFDWTSWTRQELAQSVEGMFQDASRKQKESVLGIVSIFDFLEETQENPFPHPPHVGEKVPLQKLLRREKELLGFYLTGHPMDEFASVLQKLSIVPFSSIANLQDGALFRAAFIVDSVTTRISSKSQKKFAILTISDGIDHFELPIWPELYQEKSLLLTENQLLYAVLQVEKRDDELKLQCHWLGDLTRADEGMIAECDATMDKIRARPKRSGFYEKKQAEKERETPKMKRNKLVIEIDLDKIRHTQILSLKRLFRTASGEIPVDLEFQSQGLYVATVAIGAAWGVNSDKIEGQLRSFEAIKGWKIL